MAVSISVGNRWGWRGVNPSCRERLKEKMARCYNECNEQMIVGISNNPQFSLPIMDSLSKLITVLCVFVIILMIGYSVYTLLMKCHVSN